MYEHTCNNNRKKKSILSNLVTTNDIITKFQTYKNFKKKYAYFLCVHVYRALESEVYIKFVNI